MSRDAARGFALVRTFRSYTRYCRRRPHTTHRVVSGRLGDASVCTRSSNEDDIEFAIEDDEELYEAALAASQRPGGDPLAGLLRDMARPRPTAALHSLSRLRSSAWQLPHAPPG